MPAARPGRGLPRRAPACRRCLAAYNFQPARNIRKCWRPHFARPPVESPAAHNGTDMLSTSLLHRRAASWAVAATGLALLALAVAPAGEAPPPAQPGRAALELSPSGKVLDRAPGAATAPSRFAVTPPPSDWSRLAMPASGIAPATSAVERSGAIGDPRAGRPVPIAAATAPAPAPHPARLVARAPKASVAIAALPPPRPASFPASRGMAAAASPETHPSVASRMLAFVGSLASRVRPL